MAKSKTKTREEWLLKVTDEVFRPWFKKQGHPLPKRLRVGVGFTSQGKRGKRIGECWSDDVSGDKTREVVLHIVLDDAMSVLATLFHELVHAALPWGVGHGREFKALAVAGGLEGKMTETHAGLGFTEWMRPVIKAMPRYPHSGLNATQSTIKKQGTRLIKCSCPECGYTVRTTAKWIEVGLPVCPADGISMEVG